MARQQDPSAVVIPFGKHKGATVAELLAKDPDYVQWLMAQGWLAQRFAELHAAIITRGAAPDDTPEHNQLQARFLDPVFQVAFLLAIGEIDPQQPTQCASLLREWRLEDVAYKEKRYEEERGRHERYPHDPSVAERLADATEGLDRVRKVAAQSPQIYLQIAVLFEVAGVDVRLDPIWRYAGDSALGSVSRWPYVSPVNVELKPTLGDDYPSVMRQMQRLRCKYLVLGQYTGAGASFDNVRRMFRANNATITTLQEIEAELPYARAIPTRD